jgi:hypothetical protein
VDVKELADELVYWFGSEIFARGIGLVPVIIQPLAADAQTQNARMQGVRLFDREPPPQKPQVA